MKEVDRSWRIITPIYLHIFETFYNKKVIKIGKRDSNSFTRVIVKNQFYNFLTSYLFGTLKAIGEFVKICE